MLETLKKLMDNLVSLFQKIRCSFTCCNSEVSVRVSERSKTMKPEKIKPLRQFETSAPLSWQPP